MSEHTPPPWSIEDLEPYGRVTERHDNGACGDPECCGGYSEWSEITRPNAAYIVRCVNSHEQLVRALENAVSIMDVFIAHAPESPALADIKAVLAQAKSS